jgi:competence protein ComEA
MKGHGNLLDDMKDRQKRKGLGLGFAGIPLTKLLIPAGLLLAVLGAGFLILQPEPESFALIKAETEQEALADGAASDASTTAEDVAVAAAATTAAPEPRIIVYVSGAVANPAVYELPEGARINDAVWAAGGLREDAATGYVNLAAPLTDGQQVNIPSVAEVEAGVLPKPMSDGTAPSAANGQNAGEATLININTATEEQLVSLPGIGSVTAGRIIAYRVANGAFVQTEDLKKVSGIGEKKYAALVGLIGV